MLTVQRVIPPLRPSVQVPERGSIQCNMYGGTAEQVLLLLQAPGLGDSSLTMIEESLAGVGEGYDRLLPGNAFGSPAGGAGL
jgi:hypothetical protein